jgi:hypothetical protein
MCSMHECVLGPDRCASDSDCEPYEVCDEGSWTCELAPGYCERDGDCGYWQHCEDMECVANEGSCDSDSDCGEGETCSSHTCEEAEVEEAEEPEEENLSEVCAPLIDEFAEKYTKAMQDQQATPKEEEPKDEGEDLLPLLLGGLVLLVLGGAAGWHTGRRSAEGGETEYEYEEE